MFIIQNRGIFGVGGGGRGVELYVFDAMLWFGLFVHCGAGCCCLKCIYYHVVCVIGKCCICWCNNI